MSQAAIAMLIWLGVDILLGVTAVPVIVQILVPGLVNAWARHDVAYMVSVLTPNILLFIVPGAIVAGAYVLIANKISRSQ